MKEINLLPKQYRTNIGNRKTQQRFAICIGVLFLIMTGSAVLVEYTYRRFQQQSMDYDQQLQDPKFISGEKLQNELLQLKTTVGQIEDILSQVDQNKLDLTPIITHLSTQLPKSLRLGQLNYAEDTKQLTVTYETLDKTLIPIFMDELGRYSQFNEIHMTKLDKNNFDVTVFTLEIFLKQ